MSIIGLSLQYFGLFLTIVVFHELGHLVMAKAAGKDAHIEYRLGKDVNVISDELPRKQHELVLWSGIVFGSVPLMLAWLAYFVSWVDLVVLIFFTVSYFWGWIRPDIRILHSLRRGVDHDESL